MESDSLDALASAIADGENGRQASEAPSSSSDFYALSVAEAKDADPPSNVTECHDVLDMPVPDFPMEASDAAEPLSEADPQEEVTVPAIAEADIEDSGSEMDMSSESSRDSTPEPPAAVRAEPTTKRKMDDDTNAGDGADVAAKKQKVSPSREFQDHGHSLPSTAGLPAEIWQHVFLNFSPAMLARCLRVNKAFNIYLTRVKSGTNAQSPKPVVSTVESESIWTQARKTYYPNLPRPLARCSELDMLKLTGGRSCQFCNRPPLPTPVTGIFAAGPGLDGLRVVWPFAIRTCGRCLDQQTLKDVQILVSSAAPLRQGLPYAFRTPDMHVVLEMTRQIPGGIPSHLRVAKVYYQQDVNKILAELQNAQSFGDGAAEEWRKGLVDRGKEAMADASRWEKWESQLGLGANLSQVLREYDPLFASVVDLEGESRSIGINGTQSAVYVHVTHPLPQPVHLHYQAGYGMAPLASGQSTQQYPRPQARNPYEVEEARNARRAEIERRCLDLQPPLEPSVLQHIEAFRAAMQITTPLTDASWEMLKPRILAQRESAELIEHQRAEQLAALQAAMPIQPSEDPMSKPAKEVYDREYELQQAPLRKRLAEYADDYINGQWHGARMLDIENCPTFAADVLLHVRRRFLDEAAAREPSVPSEGSGKPDSTPADFLSLDNMKWLYDAKVKPLTEQFRREIFICSGCDELKPKWFAFEGLIQHYGAKHTTEFSQGNIVVHWQTAEWPDDPPFHPEPMQRSMPNKSKRRESGHKTYGRSRVGTSTPQVKHDGPFVAPTSTPLLLSQTPFFSSGSPSLSSNGHFAAQALSYQNGHGPGHSGYAYLQDGYHADSYGQQNAQAESDLYDDQLNELASVAREIWDRIQDVKDLLECIKIQTVIQHVVVKFQARFGRKPDLDLLTDALATHMLMRPIKNANGLACRICVASQPDGAADYKSYYARIRNSKLYNASSLITHFKIMHLPQGSTSYGSSPDWTQDMIETPELQLIADVVRSPGMNDDKLALIAATFSTAFPSPLPRIGVVRELGPDVGPDTGLASRIMQRHMNKKPKQKKRHPHANGGRSEREQSHESMPEPAEDEYDPRRPIFVGTNGNRSAPSSETTMDASRFDTDISRRQPSHPAAPPPAFALAPETLAALASLQNALAAQTNTQTSMRHSRSPSVGRNAVAATPYAAGHEYDAPNGQHQYLPLDVPSPETGSARPVSRTFSSLHGGSRAMQYATYSPTRPQYVHHEAQPSMPAGEGRRSGERYVMLEDQHQTRESTHHHEEMGPREQSIARSRSTRFQRYDEQERQLSQAPGPPSPQRLQYVYEDGRPYVPQPYEPLPPASEPIYREAPVQYISRQDREVVPVQYRYERPAQIQYVDEYGRPLELIPIHEAAPPPKRYMEPVYTDEYGRSAPLPYEAHLQGAHLQPAYDDGRPVYYEQAPQPVNEPQRFVYDEEARASVGR